MKRIPPINTLLSLFIMSSLISACGKQTTAFTPDIQPNATLQEFMLAVIDPNIDPIWNAVSTTVSKEGVKEKAPANDAEWAELRQHAIVLIEAANLLQLPNRQVANAGASTSIHPVEQDPQSIAKLIAQHPDDFADKAKGFQQAVKLVLVAIDNKSPEALLKAGEGVEKACEVCHSTYWYPHDKRPVSWQSLGGQYAGLYARMRGVRNEPS